MSWPIAKRLDPSVNDISLIRRERLGVNLAARRMLRGYHVRINMLSLGDLVIEHLNVGAVVP